MGLEDARVHGFVVSDLRVEPSGAQQQGVSGRVERAGTRYEEKGFLAGNGGVGHVHVIAGPAPGLSADQAFRLIEIAHTSDVAGIRDVALSMVLRYLNPPMVVPAGGINP